MATPLEQEALKRKERLKNLRKRPAPDENGSSSSTGLENERKEKLPTPVFRSYKPIDESLHDKLLPKTIPADVTEKIQGHLEATKTEKIVDEVDLVNLAPRKPDWDLKRDVAKKLEKLERRTQRAIAELIRERLRTGSEDLAQVVNTGGGPDRMDEDEDD